MFVYFYEFVVQFAHCPGPGTTRKADSLFSPFETVVAHREPPLHNVCCFLMNVFFACRNRGSSKWLLCSHPFNLVFPCMAKWTSVVTSD